MGDTAKTGVAQRVLDFLRWLSRGDALPQNEVRPQRAPWAGKVRTWLAAHETLPRLPSALHDPKRRLLWVISPEDLPDKSRREATESRSFIRWLVSPEMLPSPPIDSIHKEASRDEP